MRRIAIIAMALTPVLAGAETWQRATSEAEVRAAGISRIRQNTVQCRARQLGQLAGAGRAILQRMAAHGQLGLL